MRRYSLEGRRIIPAYAGSTILRRTATTTRRDHPRIRGEHCASSVFTADVQGSSPHTRGAPPDCRSPNGVGRIIPAYAGSTSGAHLDGSPVRDHPRIRGEHTPGSWTPSTGPGSSPHTRGAPRKAAMRRLPAADHPRIRGEHCEVVKGQPSAHRIIPAYAGSTQGLLERGVCVADHPRIRGEHSKPATTTPPRNGSSPHTRGAHLEIPAIPRIAAVIIPVFLYPSPTPQEEADRSMVLLTLS